MNNTEPVYPFVDISHPQRKADMREALRRALNTWERPPEWLTRLYDELGG